MIDAAVLAFQDILSPPFRSVLLKSLALTIGLLAALWFLLDRLLNHFVHLPYAWLETAFSILSGVALIVALGFLVTPVMTLFAGLFLDDIAEKVERTHYPGDPVGQAVPLLRGMVLSLKFLVLVLVVNAIALPLVIFVGFGLVIFLVANGYLLGREFFDLAALRHHRESDVRRLRARHGGRIFIAGLIIAGFAAIPVANLLAPLFGTAFMVHIRKRVDDDERRAGRAASAVQPVGR